MQEPLGEILQGSRLQKNVLQITVAHIVTDPHGQLWDYGFHIHTGILVLQIEPFTQ